MVQRAYDFATGQMGGAGTGDVDPKLAAHVDQSARVARGAAAGKGDRRDKVPRYMMQVVEHLRIQNTLATLPNIEGLACAYTHLRLQEPPPFRWKKVAAPGLMSDLSSFAETLRLSRIVPDVPEYCGTIPQRELEKKGGKDLPEHSNSLPIHLSLLLKTPVPKKPRIRKARNFFIVMSFFGLRTGIVFGLDKRMFVSWMGGFFLTWRFATKRRQGDRSKSAGTGALPTTRKIHYTAARHAWLSEFFRGAPEGPMFDDVTYDELNEFLHSFVPNVPEAYDIRVYGVRNAADTEAVEMDAPRRLIDMVFDWTPAKREMPAHYSGGNILLMYQLSNERANNIEVVPLSPGLYAVAYRGDELPSWRLPIIPRLAPPLQRPDPAEVNAAWKCPAPRDRRGRQPAAGGAGGGGASRDPSPTLSIDCVECGDHVSRADDGAMCEVPSCAWGKCMSCFPDLSLELRCPRHQR
jgi:hypothetical protein